VRSLFHRRFSPVWVFKWSYLKRVSQTREGANDHRAKATIEGSANTIEQAAL